ncbi:MAG: LysR family transcriptional regulator [Bacteroidales bacterium]|nr:LysR family transcriptional regulator [Bacteroidales bacterium]
MTFQQLEYIVAVDKYRHFVNAATACGVTQSTLSSTINKLEQEIDVIIFDRSKHPIEPTALGRQIITQASTILHNSEMLRELVQNEKEGDKGELRIGMTPSIAPAIYPMFVKHSRVLYPHIITHIFEASVVNVIDSLQKAEIDMAIVASNDIKDSNLLEIELFTERFFLYVSPSHALHNRERVTPQDLQDGAMWILQEFHDRYPQLSEVVHQETLHKSFLETGGLSTLISTIDLNGGYTLMPQLFENTLNDKQKQNVRMIMSPKFFRTVSLVIRKEYMRERMLNIVADVIKHVIPDEMINPRLKKFKITL